MTRDEAKAEAVARQLTWEANNRIQNARMEQSIAAHSMRLQAVPEPDYGVTLGHASLIRAEVLMGMTVLRPEYAVTTQAPRSVHRQGLDRAYNPPPPTHRLARAVFFKPSKAPARARG